MTGVARLAIRTVERKMPPSGNWTAPGYSAIGCGPTATTRRSCVPCVAQSLPSRNGGVCLASREPAA